MIETVFSEYGLIGAFVASQFVLIKWLMAKDDLKDANMAGVIAENSKVIRNNTQALAVVVERLRN